jgi:hypothetical protein
VVQPQQDGVGQRPQRHTVVLVAALRPPARDHTAKTQTHEHTQRERWARRLQLQR